jgi:NAD-dependent deacetylase
MKKKLVILTGAGMSKESGIDTFRDSTDGLWLNYKVEEVAHVDGWRKDKQKVLDFYNLRRAQLHTVVPNSAHIALAELEKDYDVRIVTQNVDDLHERAGSTNVLHLHGELVKACSSKNKALTVPYEGPIAIGDKHEDGSQLRPFIVWFGEDVPRLGDAMSIMYEADIVVVIGTSMNVYPAATLVGCEPKGVPVYNINPDQLYIPGVTLIQEPATIGVPKFIEILKQLK